MLRHAAAVALAVCFSSAGLYAQTEPSAERFTVSAASANVHKGPSTASPVIGRAPRGAVLDVKRDLGSWVKVAWPKAEGGMAYVHVSTGSMARASSGDAAYLRQSVRSVSARSAARNGGAHAAPPPPSRSEPEIAPDRAAAPQFTYVRPPSHVIGLGGRMSGSTFGYGGSVRGWSRKQFGVQMEVSHFSQTSDVTPERLSSLQFAPSATYSFRDRVSDHIWIRPYVGGGISIIRSTLKAAPGSTAPSVNDNHMGYQAFGGAEFTFPSVARFAISADAGYQWASSPFQGFEVGGMGFSISGHWYVK